MPASKRFINISECTMNDIAFFSVQSVQVDTQGKTVTGWGDADAFPTLKKVVQGDPVATVVSEDKSVLSTMPVGTTGSLVWREDDAVNGSGVGSLTGTLANAVVANHSNTGNYAQLGRLTTRIEAQSTDGVTSPLSFAVGV